MNEFEGRDMRIEEPKAEEGTCHVPEGEAAEERPGTLEVPPAPEEGEPDGSKRKSRGLWIALAILVLVAVIGIVAFKQYTAFGKKEDVIRVELGEKLSDKVTDYVKASSHVASKAKLDISEVDSRKLGTYAGKATYNGKTVRFKVKVVDTKGPEVTLKEDLYCVMDQEADTDSIIEEVKDAGKVAKVSLKEAQIEKKDAEKNQAGYIPAYFKYKEAGKKQKNTLIVTDDSGNETEVEFTIDVLESDYLSHVEGFKDFTVEKDSTVDFMEGITYDDTIKEVKADSSKVKMDTIGEYDLTYTVTVDNDAQTVLTKVVKVKVVDKEEAQELAESGAEVHTSSGVKNDAGGSKAPSGAGSGATGGGTSSGSGSSGGGGKQKVWHDPVYKQVWVVDQKAWTEYVPVYTEVSICNVCGADVTGNTSAHAYQHAVAGEGGGHHSEVRQTGTNAVNHPEVGHWENQLVRDGYWE